MKFNEIVENLQEKNKGYIVLVRNGIFFIAIGKDAVIIHEIFELKPICFKEKTCKCVIPVKSIEKYINKIAEKGLSVILYNYTKIDKNINTTEEIFRISNKKIYKQKSNIECSKCWYKQQKEKNKIENILYRLQNMNNKCTEKEEENE